MKKENTTISGLKSLSIIALTFVLLIAIGFFYNNGINVPSNLLTTENNSNTNTVLKVLAGSELKDIEPMLATIQERTGVQLQMEYIGTLDGVEKIINNSTAYDIAWFSHGKYLSLLQASKKIIQTQEKIAISPVIPAVKESLAKQWGWINNTNVTWTDIAEKIKTGQFKYAMTDPTASNSGLSTVMSVQAAFANKGDVITVNDVNNEQLNLFFSGHSLTAGSSGFLSESYLRSQAKLAGLFNYESELLKLNRNPVLQEKLVLIYPKEGVITADYPFMLLNQTQMASYQKVVKYLKSTEFQTWLVNNTDRRPVNSDVILGDAFPKGYLMELPFPNDIATVNEILFAYLNERKKPSHAIFVLDISGSMNGSRLSDLKQAINNLTGDDKTLTGQFAKFRNRELITIITFNNLIQQAREFSIDKEGKGLQEIKDYVNSLKAIGGTAIFDALQTAYTLARDTMRKDPNRFYSIVLMTDGLNQDGIPYEDFALSYSEYEQSGSYGIPIFSILFGEANSNQLQALADLSGGKVFDSRKNSLALAFKQIRGYQ